MPYLIEILESGKNKIHHLYPGVYRVGRNLDNEIFVNHNSVSRLHAEIIVKPDQTIIKDCQSRNHTYVNQIEIIELPIEEGDLIAFGLAVFRYTTKTKSAVSPSQPQLSSSDRENIDRSIVKKYDYSEGLPYFNATLSDRVVNKNLDRANDSESIALKKLSLLLEISQKLCSPEEPEAMLAKILQLIFKVIEIDRAAILLVDEDSQELVCKATKLAAEIQDNSRFYSRSIANLARETGEILLINNALQDFRFQEAKSILLSSIHASICVPLIVNHNTIGVLYIDNLSMNSIYSDEDVEFLAGIAAISATAIHMGNTFKKKEEALLSQIEELQIKIDPAKRKAEVAQVMEDINWNLLSKISRKWKNDEY